MLDSFLFLLGRLLIRSHQMFRTIKTRASSWITKGWRVNLMNLPGGPRPSGGRVRLDHVRRAVEYAGVCDGGRHPSARWMSRAVQKASARDWLRERRTWWHRRWLVRDSTEICGAARNGTWSRGREGVGGPASSYSSAFRICCPVELHPRQPRWAAEGRFL